ncbi:glycoside hydrolase family 3 protein [Neogemmobacter tilapiae]|uniref:beta-N-acetylhexosaminidase n=1 Tax=Neogemmobacter tilapiae TaxID=875041 RepID=A0A918TX38_9RHOB|nr:glycoside hydrolase family 3 N-terminal domain-containing protein [Gemmobacter tilapiae]GHC65800.1 glycoside hydrolase family 3 [Gemmobacter tilapiae]
MFKAEYKAILTAAPFHLDDAGMAWVEATLASLSAEEKIGQLFILASMGMDPGEPERLAALKPAGITRFFLSGDRDAELGFLDQVRADARVPMLVSADLEGSRMSLPFGTEVPNPLALAAVDDVQATTAISRIMADEARATGINWSFTPVIDINAAFRSAIVATRGFGSQVDRIERHALAQIAAFQAAGVAATVKHWPGEGHDDRDQHLVTTVNPLTLTEWEESHGRLYRAAIDQGVMAVMSAHIAFPAFVRELAPGAELEAYRPASISRVLTQTLLRERLGFNGLIVSDATGMAGLGAWGKRSECLPEVISAGCDLILFSNDPVQDMGYIRAALADGRITAARHEEALVRVLGLKAALGLHKASVLERSVLGSAQNKATAQAVTARVPTLVKDVKGLLPLSPAKHRRVLVITGGVVSPIHPEPFAFDLPEMLRSEGFEVTLYDKSTPQNPKDFDLVIYLLGEETLLTRGRIFLDWLRLTGDFRLAMERPWHEVPTMLISFGYPYYLYDAPRMPCVVNAYATMPSMQKAAVDCLLGRAPWQGQSPVDPFCGQEEARY